jgi:hypothetical protein
MPYGLPNFWMIDADAQLVCLIQVRLLQPYASGCRCDTFGGSDSSDSGSVT